MRNYHRLVLGSAITLLVSGVLFQSRPAHAMRYVELNIWVNRKPALRTSVGDSGHEDAATVWRYFRRLPLRPMNGYRIKPDPGHPQRATLKGRIYLETRGGTEARVDRLRLIRSPADGQWYVAPAEVERTFRLQKPRKAFSVRP